MKEAKYYKKLDDSAVQCQLCPQVCEIGEGKRGMCIGRKNEKGLLYAASYGETISVSMDPIEKKPLYHFYPGKQILSVGPNGCNLTCDFCQNYNISQQRAVTSAITAQGLVTLCRQYNSIGVAFTYTEPLIWYEFILDTAKILKENKLQVVLVTNGFINPKPLREILPLIDAMNIDLKSMNNEFYKRYCSGLLEPVKQTIKTAAPSTHIEITNLIITDLNDSRDEIEELVDFVASVDPEIPLHFSRYFPVYKMNKPPTQPATLKMAFDIAKKKLSYVYIGNIQIPDTHNTHCPDCDELLIKRAGYYTMIENITKEDTCRNCGREIKGVHLFE
ncbi:MAG TPA: AmmeMemoRadiSam system radical SAM enzyme [Candidatus Cloacimonetes bacterium]|nr:AmmeMemoRadiSam system radical SAM enzyme [Candidatus Cloacimonadota bacterium]